jgi:hypothetical protein
MEVHGFTLIFSSPPLDTRIGWMIFCSSDNGRIEHLMSVVPLLS